MTNASSHLDELDERCLEIAKALEKLRARAKLGHTAGCPCQSRPDRSCRELRRVVGWRLVEEVFGAAGSENKRNEDV